MVWMNKQWKWFEFPRNAEDQCGDVCKHYGGVEPSHCTREPGHKGKHADYEDSNIFYTWDNGSSRGLSYKGIALSGYRMYLCSECGIVTYWHHSGESDGKCFTCKFWLDRAVDFDPSHQVVINNRFYGVGKAKKPSPHNGFGGSWYTIEHDDGRVTKTCDLWYGGEVPWEFQEILPNTAKFIKD